MSIIYKIIECRRILIDGSYAFVDTDKSRITAIFSDAWEAKDFVSKNNKENSENFYFVSIASTFGLFKK